MNLQRLNAADAQTAEDELLRCCGSRHWAREMVSRRPYESLEELQATAETVAGSMTRDDWLEAFSHHPRIGDREALRARYATAGAAAGSGGGDGSDDTPGDEAWEAGEQAGVQHASDDVLDRLADGNRAYEQRFGFVFLVCATGKSAPEMLDLLEQRLPNDPAQEWRVAAGEQRLITALRLEKLVNA